MVNDLILAVTPRRPQNARKSPNAPRKQKGSFVGHVGVHGAVRDLTGQFNIIAAQRARADEKD